MQQNIFINNVEIARANLIFDKYYDFKLSKGLSYDYLGSFKPIASFGFSFDEPPKTWFSDIRWKGAINNGICLKHIGLTGYDNGLLEFENSKYGDDEIYEAFKNDVLCLDKGSDYDRFFMTKVFDNTFRENKKIEANGEYLSFKGGFYQGFFKIENECYQTLPTSIENEISVSFSIRPVKEYGGEPEQNVFYIGTRAENKFAPFYNGEFDFSENKYFLELLTEDYLLENEYEHVDNENRLSDMNLEDGIQLTDNAKESITTDNKFIFFDETKDGFNADTWKDGDAVSMIVKKPGPSVNLFPIMHYGKNGKTIEDIEEIEESTKEKYNVNNDIFENALSIIITNEGEIGYKYLIKTCENEERIKAKVEKSKKEIIKNGEWNDITVVFNKLREGKMALSLYVNGFLVLVSINLPELHLRALDDSAKKQESVPYNISIGGGTDGLKNAIYPSDYKINDKGYLLERYFSNSFYGDIRSFTIKEK